MRSSIHRAAAAASISLALCSPGLAHVVLESGQAAPGTYKAVLVVGHGCDGQATTGLTVTVPEGFVGVRPLAMPGWTIATESGDYSQGYQLHGRAVTSGTKSVTWSGGALPDSLYAEFTVRGTLAAETAGKTLVFPVVQTCGDQEIAWTETAAPGQDPHALEHPAAVLAVSSEPAGGGEHAGHGAAAGAEHGENHGAAARAGDIEVSGAWVRAMLPGQKTGGGYLTIENAGAAADRLLAASSAASARVEIHEMKVENDVMVMRPVSGGLEVPAGGSVELAPGGYHLMFMAVPTPFAEGGTVPVTLEFEKAGKLDLELPVRAASGDDHSRH